MDFSKINNLNIIKRIKDPLVNQSIQANVSQTPSSGPSTTDLSGRTPKDKISNIEKINSLYKDFRQGKLSKNDLDRKLLNINPIILNTINEDVRINTIFVLSQTLKWLTQLKILLSTGLSPNLAADLSQPTTNSPVSSGKFKDFKTLEENEEHITNILKFGSYENQPEGIFSIKDEILQITNDPKGFSKKTKELLKVFVNDDIINPKYKVDNILLYLHNERPTFLKEIAVLFDLYAKYYETISKDFLETDLTDQTNQAAGNWDWKGFKRIKDVQPRFDMINRHILASNLQTKINYNLDLDKIGAIPEDPVEAAKLLGISTSQLGLKKRLDNLNDWLINGIIQVQVSINRINALKPISRINQNGQSVLGLNSSAGIPAHTKYEIWLILNDTKAFLESLKGLIDGSAFLTGMPSGDILEVLETNY